MQLYSAKVMLGGSRDNEVRRYDLTVPEILVLRKIHLGDEFVTDVKPLGREAKDTKIDGDEKKETLRSDAAERKRLERVYGKKRIDALFGPLGVLPQALEDMPGVTAESMTPVRRKSAPAEQSLEV